MGLGLVWGTFFYLKYQKAQAAMEQANADNGAAASQPAASPVPASTAAADAPVTSESSPDPFADFLTLSRSQKKTSAQESEAVKTDTW
jgi:hypothetical protein